MIKKLGFTTLLLTMSTFAYAGAPVWSFAPLTATRISIPADDTATAQYSVTNQSNIIHTLSLQPVAGITQVTTGAGICGNPFILRGKASCVLSLQVNGSQLIYPIHGGPIVCEQGSNLQCYSPSSNDILHLTQVPAIPTATITVTGSPLTLTTNGLTGALTISNTSLLITATNINSDFTGTALDGNVTETGNTCSTVAPQASCTLMYTPGNTVVPQTGFSIQGTNTNTVNADMQIDAGVTIDTVSLSSGPASGGTGVTVTGSGFSGATSLSFGGVPATSLNVVGSTTATAVTPAHATGAVDVEITTPSGTGAKTNGFTYVTTAVGQAAFGGTIACLTGTGNNLIAATADNSTGIVWQAVGSFIVGASSSSDGAANTTNIVNCLTNGIGCPGGTNITTYAAGLCTSYEIDSQGNTPCELGNTCYNDWYLPAIGAGDNTTQLGCLYINRAAIGGLGAGNYWSSTQMSATSAQQKNFTNGTQSDSRKNISSPVRCVRGFNP